MVNKIKKKKEALELIDVLTSNSTDQKLLDALTSTSTDQKLLDALRNG